MKALTALCAALLTAAAHAATIAVVDMNDLVRLHKNTPQDKNTLEMKLKDFQKERDELRANLETMGMELEKAAKEVDNPVLSEKNRINAREAAMKLQRDLIAAERAAQEKMAGRQREMQEDETRFLRRTSEDIRQNIKAYAESKKIDIVIDMQALPYFNTSVEITDDILRLMGVDPKLRAKEEKPAEKPAAK